MHTSVNCQRCDGRTGGCDSIMANESGCGGCNGNSSAGECILEVLGKRVA